MSSAAYNRIYKIIAVIAVSAVAAQAMHLILYRLFGGFTYFLWGLLLVFSVFGYALQSIYGAITSGRRDSRAGYNDETGYEGMEKPFKPLRAAGPLTVSAVLVLLSHGLFDALLMLLSERTPGIVYTANSVYPYIMMAAAFAGFAFGIVVWFYPAHRIISLRTMSAYLVIMWLIFLISVVSGVNAAPMTVYLLVFSVCAFIVLNQTHIQRGITDTLTVISDSGRLYNARLIIVVLVIVLFVLMLMAAVLTGLKFASQFLLLLFFAGSGGKNTVDDYYYYDVEEIEADYGKILFRNQPLGERFLFVMFIIFFILGIVFLITRGTDLTKRLITAIRTWLRELFMFFMDVRGYRGGMKQMEYEYANFRDEEISLQNADIHEYHTAAANTASYREFIARLNSLSTTSEQIRFAYVTMMRSYRTRGFGNKLSETPREAKDKIKTKTAERSLDRVTDSIETIDYAERELPESDSREIITSMCEIIEKHYIA